MKSTAFTNLKRAAIGAIALTVLSTSGAMAAKIAYSGYPTSQPFWAGLDAAVKAEAEKQGVELLDLTTPEADVAAQKDAIDTAINKGVDGIIIGGTEGHQTGNARRDGVQQAAEAAGFTVIFQICDWKGDCTYEQTLTQTKSNPDITAIFSAWDPGALAAVSAAKEAGTLGNLLIVGFDGNPANLDSIKAGEQTADIKQDNTRMGTEGVQNLLKLINGEEVPALTPIDGILIDKANVDQFIAK